MHIFLQTVIQNRNKERFLLFKTGETISEQVEKAEKDTGRYWSDALVSKDVISVIE